MFFPFIMQKHDTTKDPIIIMITGTNTSPKPINVMEERKPIITANRTIHEYFFKSKLRSFLIGMVGTKLAKENLLTS